MTDTDLVTAGDSTENDKLSNPVTPDTSSENDAQSSASDGSLATMVLPELRALANRSGVKGTSGMRKSELIAAIRESRQGGHSNGAPTTGGAGESENHATEGRQRDHTEPADDKHAAHTDAGDKPSSDDSNSGEQRDRTEKKQHNGNDKPAPRSAGQQVRRPQRGQGFRQGWRPAGLAADNRTAATTRTRTNRTTTATVAVDAAAADSGSADVVVTGPATGAVATPNCAKTTSSSRSPASSTCSTTTRSSAPPATWPVPTMCTSR